MKKLFLISFALFSMDVFSQEEPAELQAPVRFFETKLAFAIGVNVPFSLNSDVMPHGMDLAQRANTVGVAGHLAVAGEFKQRWGIEFSAGMNGCTFRRKYFEKKFSERNSGFFFQGDEEQDVTNSGGEGMDVGYLHPKLYFIANPKANNKIVPMVGVQFSFLNATTHSYVLRTPSTNYFTRYEIDQLDGKKQPFYSLGLEIRRTFATTSEKGRISNAHVALRTSLTYGKFTGNYSVNNYEFNRPVNKQEFQLEQELLFLTISLSVNMFSF